MDARRHAPAAERNREPIAKVLREVLPERGLVLEIASGTGQHTAHFAAALPGLTFQPSERDRALHASIAAWSYGLANVRPPLLLDVTVEPWPAAALPGLTFQPSERDRALHASIAAWSYGLANVRPPLLLDVTVEPWPIERADAIFNANMIHIAPWEVCLALMRGAGRCLPPGGPLVVYGPFRIGGAHTAESNAAFDRRLRGEDPRWGVRDLEAVCAAAESQGLAFERRVEMPANNQTLVFRRRP